MANLMEREFDAVNTSDVSRIVETILRSSEKGASKYNRIHEEIRKRDDFYYPTPSNVEMDIYTQSIMYACSTLINTYMKRIPQKIVQNEFFRLDEDVTQQKLNKFEQNIAVCLRRLRRIHDLRQAFGVRIYNDEGSSFCHLRGFQDDSGKPITEFFGTIVINRDGISEMNMILINLTNEFADIRQVSRTTYYCGPNSSAITKRIVRATKDVRSSLIERISVEKCLSELCSLMLERSNLTYGEKDNIKYNSMEMFLYRSVFRTLHTSAITFCVDGYNLGNDVDDSKFIFLNDQVPDILKPGTSMRNEWPLVDLTDREWKFINRYCRKELPEKIDITKYLESSRYGNTYKIRHNFGVKEPLGEREYVVSYIIDSKRDILRFHIVDYVSDAISIFTITDWDNLKEFEFENSFRHLQRDVLYTNPDDMAESTENIEKLSPLSKVPPYEIADFFEHFICMLIVLHDRPKRTRMVKCTETVKRPAPIKPKKKHKQPIQEEPEYIITRILKPVVEAKQFVDEMTRQVRSGTRREAEYTLESWERVGHYRHTRSGMTVWIDATTCHRHLPLTDKEIHIKL